jgi:hypothetical protein
MADGLLPALSESESVWFLSFLYPLRGADSLGMIAFLAGVFWVLATLIPEYCLTALGDTDEMGVPSVGRLIVLISALPAVILLPLIGIYWLQYLGRILVSSAMGETTPPRPPDRNFDGFLSGLSPWFVWLVLGLGVGLLPTAWITFSGDADASRPWIALALLSVELPYILAALMLAFLHDDPLAAKPWGVVAGLFRLGGSFWVLSALIAASLGFALATVEIALLVRPHAFWLYLLLCLGCWVVFHWTIVVVMRLLGTYYFHHKDALQWHREHPRWGVAWRL